MKSLLSSVEINGRVIDRDVIFSLFKVNLSERQLHSLLVYLSKYNLDVYQGEVFVNLDNDSKKMSITVPVSACLAAADRTGMYTGLHAGITALVNGVVEKIGGAALPEGGTLLGGWADVYRKEFHMPVHCSLSLSENRLGSEFWQEMPCVMIRKTAIVHALREAFPLDVPPLFMDLSDGNSAPHSKPVIMDTKKEWL